MPDSKRAPIQSGRLKWAVEWAKGHTHEVPEGDTIRLLADKITRRFAGQKCVACVTRDPRLSGVDFTGAVLQKAEAFGKHLFVRFDDGRSLHAHLRMTGSFVVGPASTDPEWFRRIELWMEDGRLTGVQVPILEVVATDKEASITDHLGPDLCGPLEPAVVDIVQRLLRVPDAPLAGALLDQRNVAGFGNLYAVELPFIVGISPFQPIGTVVNLASLVGLGASVIRVNARLGPQNTTGRKMRTDDHWIYPKRGRPCPLCGTLLDGRTETDSPWRRVTTWCPSCQLVESARHVDLTRARRLIGLHPALREPLFPQSRRPASDS